MRIDWWMVMFVAVIVIVMTATGYALHDYWPMLPGFGAGVLYLGGTVLYGKLRHRNG